MDDWFNHMAKLCCCTGSSFLRFLGERGQEVAVLRRSDLFPQMHQTLSQAVGVYTTLGTLVQCVSGKQHLRRVRLAAWFRAAQFPLLQFILYRLLALAFEVFTIVIHVHCLAFSLLSKVPILYKSQHDHGGLDYCR